MGRSNDRDGIRRAVSYCPDTSKKCLASAARLSDIATTGQISKPDVAGKYGSFLFPDVQRGNVFLGPKWLHAVDRDCVGVRIPALPRRRSEDAGSRGSGSPCELPTGLPDYGLITDFHPP